LIGITLESISSKRKLKVAAGVVLVISCISHLLLRNIRWIVCDKNKNVVIVTGAEIVKLAEIWWSCCRNL